MTIKAVFFDFMGTCLDWHSSVLGAFPSSIPATEASSLALQWRQKYFDLNRTRVQNGQPVESFDKTLVDALDFVLRHDFSHLASRFDATNRNEAVRAFHTLKAWPDVPPALQSLRKDGLETYVHANGSTRLQLDIVASSGLSSSFNMLFSSELLGLYLPQPEAFNKVLQLINAKPHEVVKVAAHAWDLRGAKDVGMRTIYVRRWTDDIEEDMTTLQEEFDFFLENMDDLPSVIKRLSMEE